MIFLTQNSTPIIGQVAWLLGVIMNAIFTVIDFIGIPNIGLAIILFTIVVNLLMMPLTIKQQKFSKLQIKMQPEVQAIQKKYKNKTDNDSKIAMNNEIQMVYAKYGVSPTGSCLYLLIQMPILFALYRVIYSIPAYVTKIYNTFAVLADKILEKGVDFLVTTQEGNISKTVSMYANTLASEPTQEKVIDVLNKLSTSDMAIVSNEYGLASATYGDQLILSNETTTGLIDHFNNFLGLNIGNSPQDIIVTAFKAGSWLLVIGAILIPVLSALTQWINVKLMPQQPSSGDAQADQMASSMKTMNMFFPLISAWFCFTLPAGLGLYWVAGSIVRSIQQVIINKTIDKMDFEELIQKNSKKSAKQMEKIKQNQERMNAYANMNTRSIQNKAMQNKAIVDNNKVDSEDITNSNVNYKPGSMMEKANMVKRYNEKNNKN